MHLDLEYNGITPEEEQRLDELESQLNKYLDVIETGSTEEIKDTLKRWENYNKLADEKIKLLAEIKTRYILSFKGDAGKILAAAKKVIDALEHEDFLKDIEEMQKSFANYRKIYKGKYDGSPFAEVEKYFEGTYFAAYNYIYDDIKIYLKALDPEYNNGEKLDEAPILKLVKDKVRSWGYKELFKADLTLFGDKSFLPAVHGKATDAIAMLRVKEVTDDKISNRKEIKSGEVKIVLEKVNELTGNLGVSTRKLFNTAIADFTANNHTGNDFRQLRTSTVSIPLKEYARKCGYDVFEQDTATEEEAVAEARRAKSSLDNFRRKVKKDLKVLFSLSLSWQEKIRGGKEPEDFSMVRLVEAVGLKNGYIQILFGQTFSNYLCQLPLTQYPIALLSVNEKNDNAYNMGLKFAEHFSMDNNQIRGTAQSLKVKTLLAVTSLPSIDTVRKSRKGWEERIKEPFETSLDALTACGLLEDWEYSQQKAKAMTDEEANFKSYEEWVNAFIHFTLKDAPDHAARLEARAIEKKANQKKTKRTAEKKTK